MRDTIIPESFELLPTGLGFLDALQPIYRQLTQESISFGLLVTDRHINRMGLCHGGVITTLADAMATAGVNFASGKRSGSPTISLSVDFISPGRIGQWIQAEIDHVSLKRRFGFCSGNITGPEGVIARFSGTIYLPDHQGMGRGAKNDEA